MNLVPATSGFRLDLKGGDCCLVDGAITPEDGTLLLDSLLHHVSWVQPEISMFGRRYRSPRLAAWYGDAGAVYRYSGLVNRPLPWREELLALKARLEERFVARFNSVLLNLYRDGSDSMGWHADDEPELGAEPCIVSVSLGGTRRFRLRHRFDPAVKPVSVDLVHGSVLIMRGRTQHNWKHALPRTRKPVGPRINLTFRYVSRPSGGFATDAPA